MATDSSPPYRKLPGRSIAFLSGRASTLWIGADHLLMVAGTRFSEDYKRFYFRDIKAIVVRRTRRWETSLKISGVIAVFSALLVVLSMHVKPHPNVGLAVFFGIIGGLALVALVVNVIAGPTCICHLRTPVQQEELTSLRRLRTARKTLRKIRPLIESVQGMLSEEGIGKIAQTIAGYESVPVSTVLSERPAFSGIGAPSVPAGQTSLLWHSGLILVLLVNASAALFLWYGRSQAGLALEWVSALALGGLIIAGIFINRGGRREVWTRTGLWSVWILTLVGFSYVAEIRQAIQQINTMRVAAKAGLPPGFYTTALGASLCFGLWALVEIVLLIARRGESPVEPQPTPDPQSWNR